MHLELGGRRERAQCPASSRVDPLEDREEQAAGVGLFDASTVPEGRFR